MRLESQPSYEIGEFYFFRHPTLRTGFMPCYGGIIENAVELWPEAWEYFQTEEGALLLKTEAEWQALTTATWATLASGSKVGFGGVGGAPFFVQNLNAGTLRMPDLRGMFPEAAGFNSLGVGGVKGDTIRDITGNVTQDASIDVSTAYVGNGAFYADLSANDWHASNGVVKTGNRRFQFKASRMVPTGAVTRPRSIGLLPCAYLGMPAQIETPEETEEESS